MNFLSTNQFAESLGVKPQTVRRGFCVNGHYMGITPRKMPFNGRLLWPAAELAKLLGEEENKEPAGLRGL